MRVVIPSEPRLLHILRCVVRRYAMRAGMSEDAADSLALAIDEAATNVLRHTYGNRQDGRLALEIEIYPDRIEFVMEDSGPKVQPECIRPRALGDVRPGGLGTHFIKCLTDSTSYDESFADGNRLRLVKYLPGKVSPGHEDSGSKRG